MIQPLLYKYIFNNTTLRSTYMRAMDSAHVTGRQFRLTSCCHDVPEPDPQSPSA